MSHLTIVNTSQLFAAATAISAMGLLAVPAPARAGPMSPLPLAPPCSQYVFVGDFVISEAGWQTFFGSAGPVAGGVAAAGSDDNVTKYTGYVSGGGIQGRNVDFTINFER